MTVCPAEGEPLWCCRQRSERSSERRVSIAKTQEREQRPDHRPRDFLLKIGRGVVAAIDIAPDSGPLQEVHVVGPGQKADVIDLRDAWHEALNRSCDQVLVV